MLRRGAEREGGGEGDRRTDRRTDGGLIGIQICQVSTEPGFRAHDVDRCRAEAPGGDEFTSGIFPLFLFTGLKKKHLVSDQNPPQQAVKAKLQSLAEEFEYFRSSTSHIPWCARAWWQESAEESAEEESEEESAEETLTLSDWIHLDSLFRSRVLQFPRLGIGMAPVLDFANHADHANAYYSVDADRNVVLFPRAENRTSLQEGEEVTIK